MADHPRLHRPHSQSSPLPEPTTAYRPRQQRRLPRRGTDPGHLRSAWNPYGLIIPPPVALRAMDSQHIASGFDARSQPPPYPMTPPPRLDVPVVPTLGYRAPSPVPEPSVHEEEFSHPDPQPDRLHSTKRNFLRKLDVSLKQLTYAALSTGAVLMAALALFIRYEMTGKPHTPAGTKALMIFFSVSMVAFIFFFSLVLGVLCRRSRYSKQNRAQITGVDNEVELKNFANLVARKFGIDGRETERWVRRHAVSGVSNAEQGYTVFGAWPARPNRSQYDQGRIIHRPNGLPIRVASAPLPSARFSSTLPTASSSEEVLIQRSPVSRLASNLSINSWGSQAAEASSTSHDTSLDMSVFSTTVQVSPIKSPGNDVSPKSQPRSGKMCRSETTAPSARAFDQHMRTSGSRELQAYLEMSPITHPAANSRSSNGLCIMNADDHEDDVHEVEEASVVSIRKPGMARLCHVIASPKAAEQQQVSKPANKSPRKSAAPKASKLPQHLSSDVQGSVQYKPIRPLTQRSAGNLMMNGHAKSIRNPTSQSSSPQKSSPQKPAGERLKVVGLGVMMDKENVAPEGSTGRDSRNSEL